MQMKSFRFRQGLLRACVPKAALPMVGSTLMLAACSVPVPFVPPPQAETLPGQPPLVEGRCDAAAARVAALGHQPTPEILQQARVAAGASTARVLYVGQPVTLEYMNGRLNVITNKARTTIVDVTCG